MELSVFPFPFWLTVIVIICSGMWYWRQRDHGYGLPALAVLGTCVVWYMGDAIYNDYEEYTDLFAAETLISAWWQVALFVGTFSFLVPVVFAKINGKEAAYKSKILYLVSRNQINTIEFQRAISRFHWYLVSVWLILMIIALARVGFDFKGLFFPWLGYKKEPWGRSRIGGGIDALLSLAQYFQIFLTASFGVIAALSRDSKTRNTALLICFLAMPYFLFDRTRSMMLAVVVPGILAWTTIRIKGGIAVKIVMLLFAFGVIEIWFGFVMENRNTGPTNRFYRGGKSEFNEGRKHLGLNMFQELAWINEFIEEDRFQPNWGQRYFAEVVNPVPRSLWPEKPLIGIDYAILRGQSGGSEANAGIFASISTGMIGQGVVNFGRFFGPIAAAVLMSLWVALLGRQDLLSARDPARLLLYGLGLILTFNMGRDITLLVLYPFLFGLLFFIGWKRYIAPRRSQVVRKPVLRNVDVSGVRKPDN